MLPHIFSLSVSPSLFRIVHDEKEERKRTKKKKRKNKKRIALKETEQRRDGRVDREMHRIETTRVEVLKIMRAVEERRGPEKPGKNEIVSQMCNNGGDRNKRRNERSDEAMELAK